MPRRPGQRKRDGHNTLGGNFYRAKGLSYFRSCLEPGPVVAMLAAMPTPRRHLLLAAAHLAMLACARQAAVATTNPAPSTPNPATKDVNVPPAMPKARIVVDLTHDVVCPWCRIGHHNLRTALAELGDGTVEVRLHPFLLNPDAPPEGVDLRAHLATRYGAANIEAMFQRVTQTGKQYGLHFDFSKVRIMADTSLAHTLLAAAPPAKQGALLDALHQAHFEEGMNPGDRAALLAVWVGTGLDKASGEAVLQDTAAVQSTRQAALAAARTGIGGVPHFELAGPGGQRTLHGGQSPATILQALRAVAG